MSAVASVSAAVGGSASGSAAVAAAVHGTADERKSVDAGPGVTVRNSDDHDDDEEDDDDGDDDGDDVELGFLDEVSPGEDVGHLLAGDEDHWDGGKAGGRVSWLPPLPLPATAALTCVCCKSPLLLLTQVYAPVDDVPEAYHRELYVFTCRNHDCLRKGG